MHFHWAGSTDREGTAMSGEWLWALQQPQLGRMHRPE